MQRKKVYIDDCLIGEAATWREVHMLVRACGIVFINEPRGAEGPSAFYLTGTPLERSTATLKNRA